MITREYSGILAEGCLRRQNILTGHAVARWREVVVIASGAW